MSSPMALWGSQNHLLPAEETVSEDDNKFVEVVKERTSELPYECAIVMPFGDRNLDVVHRSEQNTQLNFK